MVHTEESFSTTNDVYLVPVMTDCVCSDAMPDYGSPLLVPWAHGDDAS